MTIELSPETQRLLDERLKAGMYASADDLVREALAQLALHERDDADFQALKAKLERGAAQAERGELVDGEKAFERVLQRLEGAQATRESA